MFVIPFENFSTLLPSIPSGFVIKFQQKQPFALKNAQFLCLGLSLSDAKQCKLISDRFLYLQKIPSEEFDLTKMSWGYHDILTVTSQDYFTATSF